MMQKQQIWEEIQKRVQESRHLQKSNGAWRFIFEGSLLTDAAMIMVLQSLGSNDQLVFQLAARLQKLQQPNGAWTLYDDEGEGNLTATVLAYNALLFSKTVSKEDSRMKQAERFINKKGGLSQTHFMTKFLLAVHGQYPWPKLFHVPTPVFFLPSSFPFNIFKFSNYARIHILPMIICANKRFSLPYAAPDLTHLMAESEDAEWFLQNRSIGLHNLFQEIKKLKRYPSEYKKMGYAYLEKFMLDRIEPNGTLYSYASSTIFMIYALLALGYPKTSPVIQHALQGLHSLLIETENGVHVQNSPSTVWDTALLSYALQEAGVAEHDSMIQHANTYLLHKQHTQKGDWSVHAPKTAPGGWGFSHINTKVPDIDDTSAALRAITREAVKNETYREAWNKGVEWLLAMQNTDGGWAAFEKGANNEMLTLIPLENANDAIIDASTADLTGRALQFLGTYAGLTMEHSAVRKGVEWLLSKQEENGSWYGRWGICYVYGTWAAVTGLCAVGLTKEHPAIQKAAAWLESIQHENGGWGESCKSCEIKQYVPLGYSTPSQTAWATDALIAVYGQERKSIQKGIAYLLRQHSWSKQEIQYPTGLGLPGQFYFRYESYNYIFPLLALGNYMKRYTD
ncbi:squalene--hopene cyclase [Bacillus sp. 165]|uniref:squalene--hopene cyclase n=1 Tax=Bacillus sp. 165 TaxID=1529117 RepID=UPI001ADBD6E1|nr:squalene--hopene cyclase [Bacillus sp. 165]MBO9129110.1 squalene--hopene cyclase [Bacillus sp. 165]